MDVPLTQWARLRFREAVDRLSQIRQFICRKAPANDEVGTWFSYLSAIKALQGNANNDLSFLACLLAKQYLLQQHGPLSFDVSAKAQGLQVWTSTSETARVCE